MSEQERLQRLRQLHILDTPPDHYFGSITERALDVLPGTTIAAVSFIDAQRQWFKAVVGLSVRETPRDVALCNHTINHDEILVVENACTDKRFDKSPLVTCSPRIRFYMGIPLKDRVGTLCVASLAPRKVSHPEVDAMLQFANHVNIQLELHQTRYRLRQAAALLAASPALYAASGKQAGDRRGSGWLQ